MDYGVQRAIRAASRRAIAALSSAVAVFCVLDGEPTLADGLTAANAAPTAYALPLRACGNVHDFFLTICPLTWYGVTFYGTVDMGVSYMTHGSLFDRNYPQAVSYLAANGSTGGTSRLSGFFPAPGAMTQSNVGIKIIEPIAPGGWSFIANGELAFDPYSLLLANGPQALQNGIGVPQNQQAIPQDSSKWGWLNTNDYIGFTQPAFGTVTLGRQNALETDGVIAYDPMGGAYGFSLIGYSSKTAGAGDTDDARWNTAVKYRVSIGDVRLSGMAQPIGLFGGDGGLAAYNANSGALSAGIGGDIKHWIPGVISLDVIGTYEKDAVNATNAYGSTGTAFGPTQTMSNGWPTSFPAAYLRATISDNTGFMGLAKWSFGSWGNTPLPVADKDGPARSGPSGIPLTLYAGYEWIRFANPSDPQTAFREDGFLFVNPNLTNPGNVPGFNGTAINNNAFNGNCGKGSGCSNEILQVIWVGAKYGITKNLDVMGGYYHYIQNQYVNGPFTAAQIATTSTCANPAGLSQCAGWYDTVGFVLDWRFLPKWDWYIGTMYSGAFGGLANGDIARTNLATTTGVRFRF